MSYQTVITSNALTSSLTQTTLTSSISRNGTQGSKGDSITAVAMADASYVSANPSSSLNDLLVTITTAGGVSSVTNVGGGGFYTGAQNASTQAQAAQAAAEAALDSFDDRYLGSKTGAGDPTLDNDGNALVTGAIFWDADINRLKFYSGSSWEDPVTVAITQSTNATTQATNAAASATSATNSENTATAQASAASTSATNAATSATSASGSASTATAQAGIATTKASDATTSESNAATSASNASTSENNASNSATGAATSESNASTHATNASASATAASNSATAASTHASNASTSETNASASETNANNSKVSATNSASTATTQATNAATSATSAATSLTAVQTIFDNFDDTYLGSKASDPSVDNDGDALVAGQIYFNSTTDKVMFYNGATWQSPSAAAATSATQAATSATNANTSATNAATSETNASTSETNASNSASTATNQATTATNQAVISTNQATASTNSATASANSATSASNSATTATTQATNAANSASAASTSESNAATSETNASNSASQSATSANNSASSATNAFNSENAASTSATTATTQATNASNSASAASTSATNAATSLATFQGQYHGSATSDPSSGLDAGDLYFNSTSNTLKVYTGSAWSNAAFDTSNIGTFLNGSLANSIIPSQHEQYDLGSNTARFRDLFLSGSSIKLGNATITATSGGVADLPSGATIPSGGGQVLDATNRDTDDLTEGTTNLYYTDARARAAISESSTQLAYNSSTGVLTYTQGDTDTVSEGSSNLYYTNARADARIALQVGSNLDLSSKSTSDLSEGTNLYYTDARADARITNALKDEDNMASNSATHVPSQQSVKSYVDNEVAGIVDSAPGALNTLNELAAALGDDASFSTTVTNSIATKLPLAGGTMTGAIDMGNNNITTTGKMLFANMYASTGDLPSANTYHGMFAHVHGTGKGYYAHGGNWIELANHSQLTNSSNWDTAFGWGDHGSAGYLTSVAFSALTGKPTTIAGYGITDAYDDSDFDTRLAAKNTGNLTEGSNLYYTDARADARIAAANTDNLSEGSSNLYFTNARADARIAATDTDSISEGSSNLYFTNARADARVAAVGAPINSPNFTGTPTAPTVAGTSDSTTKIATTAFVQAVTSASSAGITSAQATAIAEEQAIAMAIALG